jgi:hypothetical protein
MEIAFGLFILAILIIGLLNRRRQKKAWLKEEHHDESGAWMDKRAGERGTYGSLDAEREKERSQISRQGKANELVRQIRDYAFEQYPGFSELNDFQIRDFSDFAKTKTTMLLATIEQLLEGKTPALTEQTLVPTEHQSALKKQILDFSYKNFPALLELEIEAIKSFDAYAESMAVSLIGKIEDLKSA